MNNLETVMNQINELKVMFSKKEAFASATLMDGTVIEYDGELAVGTAVFVVAEGEQIPAPDGTHALGGDMEGVSIIVADGAITEVIDEREGGEEGEAPAEAPAEEAMSAITEDQVEAMISAKLESFSKAIEGIGEVMTTIARENEAFRSELSEMKEAFNAFKAAPSNEVKEESKFSRNGNLSNRQAFLKNNMK